MNWRQIFCTKVGWLAITMILVVIFGTLTNWFDWAWIPMFISLSYPLILGFIMIIYAWIINPIKYLTKKK